MAPTIASAARYFTGRPAANVTTSRIGSNVTAVPRSGWRAIRRTGIAVNTTARNSSLLPRNRRRLSRQFRQHERDCGLRELGRLQIEHAESIQRREPPRTAPKGDEDEQPNERDVDDVRLVGERPVVDDERGGHRHQSQGHGVQLRPVDAAGSASRAVDHGQTDTTQREDAGDEAQSMWK